MKEAKKKVFWALFSLILAGLSIWAVMSQSKTMSILKLWKSLRDADLKWIFAAVLCMLGFIYFEGAALLVIVRAAGYRQNQFSGLVYSASDIYFSAITPSASGGQPASAYFMMKDGIPAGVTTAALIVNLIMYTMAILSIGVVSVLMDAHVFLNFKLPSKILIIAGLVVLTGLLFGFFMLLRHGRALFRVVSRIMEFLHKHHLLHHLERKQKKLDKVIEDYENCVSVTAGKTKALVLAFIFNVIQRLSQILVSVMVYNAFYGTGRASVRVFVTQSMATIGSNCIPVPGAMGVADYLMLDGFKDLLEQEQAIHLEMMSRGISFYICIVISGLTTILGYLIFKNKRQGNR